LKPLIVGKVLPAVWRTLMDRGKEYMDQPTLSELCVWLDALDRI
jgi:hypothetical protein